MDYWTELRTALMVARHGTVSAAASVLGVHRATVNRHIEVLEGALATTLFQRHARGYTLTDAGREMLEVAGRADEMFADLEGRSRGRAGQLSGELIVTALRGIVPLVMPAIKAMHEAYPEIAIEFVTGEKLARLEHGEAHVAFRVGPKPDVPDYVVLPFGRLRFGLYASQHYLARYGHPGSEGFEGHVFVGSVGEPSRIPYADWMETNVTPQSLALRTSTQLCVQEAISAGMGLGFLAEHDAKRLSKLIEILPPSDDCSTAIWIVTHVDLHRTEKVQGFLHLVRREARSAAKSGGSNASGR